ALHVAHGGSGQTSVFAGNCADLFARGLARGIDDVHSSSGSLSTAAKGGAGIGGAAQERLRRALLQSWRLGHCSSLEGHGGFAGVPVAGRSVCLAAENPVLPQRLFLSFVCRCMAS